MPFPDLYGALARRRRQWYEVHPGARRRLDRPVVSIGSLTVGGSGKTPVAADVATVLRSLGERPAVLSRGYGRRRRSASAVVVSNRGVLQAGLDEAGDEPFMLARQLADTSVVVAEDRYSAGELAEARLGATVHVLDDGFQHLQLCRDVDLLVIGREELVAPRTLPLGRLREPVDTAARADAVVVEETDDTSARLVADRLGVREAFRFTRRLDEPQSLDCATPVALHAGASVLAFAGIARPARFVDDLRSAGYDVVDFMSFRDHHVYTRRNVRTIRDRLAASGADWAVTTEKDVVKLLPFAPLDVPVLWIPMRVRVAPVDRFERWLASRVAAARGRG